MLTPLCPLLYNRTITRHHSLPEICHWKELLYITVAAQNKLLTAHEIRTDGLSDTFTVNRDSLTFSYYKLMFLQGISLGRLN